MKTYNTLITEISFNFLKPLKNLFNSIVERVRNAINSLSFGEKISVRINMNMLKEDTIDMKSRLGYYSEYVTGYELSKLIENAGGNLTTERSKPSVLKGQMLQKKKELTSAKLTDKDKKSLPGEMIRMESAGAALASQIFQDMILNGNDYNALQFDIHLTGVEEKGISKSDLILTSGKMNKREIVDRISASLKAYKTPSINLSNNTYISLVKNLFYDEPDVKSFGKDIPKFIRKFVDDYGSKEDLNKLNADLNKLYALQTIIKTKLQAGETRKDARDYSKTTHPDVINLLVKLFNKYYEENKTDVNRRILKILGLDSTDDFYAAIGQKKQKVISSRKSKEMREVLAQLQNDFTLHLERNKATKNISISFKSPNGEVILDGNVTFADTGGANAQGKINAFFKMGKFI
jgi:hypothetical protein